MKLLVTHESSSSGICLLTSGDGSFLRKSWLKAGLGIGLASGAGAAAVVAGRFDWSTFFFCVCRYGERAAAGEVEENGCEHDGLLLDIDLMALVPGLRATLDAMLCSAREKLEREFKKKTPGTK